MKSKNLIAATSIAAAAAVVLGGCSSGDASQPNPSSSGKVEGELTGLFFSGFKDTYEKIVTEFEKKYPNVKVKFNYQGGDIGALAMTQLQAGTAPDILTSFPGGDAKDSADSVVPLAAQGHIAPLNVTWASKIPQGWTSSFNYNGKVYAYPGAFQPLSAVYNKTKLDQVGLKIPTTLDEVYQLCADAKAKGVYAYAMGLGDGAAGPQMLSFAQAATLIYGPNPTFDKDLADGKVTYPNSKWVDQFKIYKKMFDDGCFGPGALGRSRDQASTAAATGQALGTVDVGAVLAVMQKAAPKNSFVISPMPATNDGKTFITALPGFVTTVNAKAKNMAAAQAFMEFLGQPDISVIYAKGFASVPVLPNDQYKAPAELEAFAKANSAGQTTQLPAVQAEVQATLNSQIQAMLLGKTTPEGVAERMQKVYKK
ncbi:ABC transporter substrate-binding protein [Pedococcus sp. 5OH_020]|uniref:ABC transporter substrate-binding protein n=1 Tax=Pedococcus sp. 5OH_020 TaxID=2989814 RepID=UPI0022E99924|nr:extracellular solute-binding protein [Pedococcus sp. 5OH_020]